MATSDYLIVGAGSAGCVLANRLSANPGTTVMLLEAGGRDRNPWLHVPAGYFKTMSDPRFSWRYETEPDDGVNGRRIVWPRGKVLGGSSSINGLIYVRGQPEDYNQWRQAGNVGWSWDDLLPLFIRAESREDGAAKLRGGSGPLAVSSQSYNHEVCDAWVKAAEAEGHRFNEDYNGADQEGVGYFEQTTRKGVRCSTAAGYLKPARRRRNLRIVPRARALRILFEGKRAVGVECLSGSAGKTKFRARKEVVVACGAIGTPHLLMLSGVGDADMLQGFDLKPVADLRGVGKNLQDHLQVRPVFKCRVPTLNTHMPKIWKRVEFALEYLLFRTGPLTMAASSATGFLRTGEHAATPDIEFHIQPWSADNPGESLHPFPGFTTSVCVLRPESRGRIRLKSPDPLQFPAIHPNYLSAHADRETIVAGAKIARRIAAREPLASKIESEHRPGHDVASDEDLLSWARSTATTIFHPVGTCKMGQDSEAVVDERLRVRGLTGLRVADCSIMPTIVSGNTNAAAIMIGEKASDLIKEDQASAAA